MNKYYLIASKMKGDIVAPSSKSHTLRAILFASLAQGNSVIKQYLQSPDTDAMMSACRSLGAGIKSTKDCLFITGFAAKPTIPDNVIDAGNSGQVLRFIAAIASLCSAYVVVTGDHSVRHNRPMKPLLDGLSQLDVFCTSTKNDDYAPVIIKGPLQAGKTFLDGQDSQPVSALLMACAFADGESEIQVMNPGEKPWVGVTLDWFDRLGIEYENHQFEFYKISGRSKINGFEYTVPGDFSSIAYPLVSALICKSDITITNIDMQDAQGDKKLIEILVKMGAHIIFDEKSHKIEIKSGTQLQGEVINVNDFIDAVPILAVLGCFAEGETQITHAEIARKKESNRVAVIVSELKKMGADIEETVDGLKVRQSKLKGSTVESFDDHRIAMSLAVAGLAAEGETVIKNIDCVSKSYGCFLQDMNALGAQIKVMT